MLAALRRDADVAKLPEFWNGKPSAPPQEIATTSPTTICFPERIWWSCGGFSRNVLTFVNTPVIAYQQYPETLADLLPVCNTRTLRLLGRGKANSD